ncbi:hypothetical protein KKB40_03875, partial [Patescibacteria group bacterium]|nr:hypothetical protein [Patescibacteria group bacterium]
MKFKLNIPLENIISKLKLLKQNRLVFVGILSVSLISLLIFTLSLYYYNRIFPGVSVVNISVANKTPAQAEKILKEKIAPLENISLTTGDQTFEIGLQEIDFSYDYSESATSAYFLYRSRGFFQNATDSLKSLSIGASRAGKDNGRYLRDVRTKRRR